MTIINSLENNLKNLKNVQNEQNNEINLTESQQKVYDGLIDFVKSNEQTELLLIGYAGTGKTTLVSKFINDLIKTKLCKKIVMAAPTHKAVNIAKSKLFDSQSNIDELNKIINIMTVHRLLNYQSYVGLSGEKFFAKGKIEPNWLIYDLIVVDECSMLSNQIISDIKEQIKKNPNIKVIYVGDPAQLPPVNQADSKIFSSDIKILKLEKIIRTSNKNIMELSNSHRKWIFSKKEDDIPHVGDFESENINLFSSENKELKNWLDEFVQLLKSNGKNKKIISEYDEGIEKNISDSNSDSEQINILNDYEKMIDNHNNNIILTWTNKKSELYNQYIREKIFNKKDLAQWEIGEILIFNDFHKRELVIQDSNDIDIDLDGKSEKINLVSFYTSEQVKLIDISEIKYKCKKLKFKINNNITTELNDKFRKYYKKINEIIDLELDVYQMKVQKIIDLIENKLDVIPEYTILSINSNSEKKYNKIIESIEEEIIKLKLSAYKIITKTKGNDNSKCELQSEVEKKINRLYKEYQTNVIDCFANLNYGYCITVHKSQGSTFKNVYIDINDILDNNNMNETSKCLYTAITRSSKSLKLYI